MMQLESLSGSLFKPLSAEESKNLLGGEPIGTFTQHSTINGQYWDTHEDTDTLGT